jgi:sterol desaturase/sphingolipid hydroxylase (fatty acid hydroxylase superfamily)
MTMEDWQIALRAGFEPLQYAAFFGALLLFGLAERVAGLAPDSARPASRWPANFALTFLNVLVLAALPVSGLAAADWAAAQGFGALAWLGAPPAFALAAGFLLRGLIAWAIHYAMHKMPALWRVHRVHHCDPALDVSTTVRFHPLEFAISAPVLIAAIAFLGIPPVAILIYELLDAALAPFTHANLRLPAWLERKLSWVVATPHLHRIHHSPDRTETDSNFGAVLTLWDRVFGTYRAKDAADLAAQRVGLDDPAAVRPSSPAALLALPFRKGG